MSLLMNLGNDILFEGTEQGCMNILFPVDG